MAIEKDKYSDLLLVASVTLIVGVTAFLIYRTRLAERFNYLRSQAQSYANRPKILTLSLLEQNGSGQSGKVTLKEVDGKVAVSIFTEGAPQGVSQPAHIHAGSCAALGEIIYPLTNVLNGQSQTELMLGMNAIARLKH